MFDWLFGKNKNYLNFKEDDNLEETLLKIHNSKLLHNVINTKRPLGELYEPFIKLHRVLPPARVTFRDNDDVFYYWALYFAGSDKNLNGLGVAVSNCHYYSQMPLKANPVFKDKWGCLCFKQSLADIAPDGVVSLFYFLPKLVTPQEIKENLNNYLHVNLERYENDLKQYRGALSLEKENNKGGLSLTHEEGALSSPKK